MPFRTWRERHRVSAWALGAVGASLVLLIPWLAFPRLQVAHIGDLPLENGDVIRDAVIGYRTAGRLNAARTNAVLVTPWFQGTSWKVSRQIGPGRLVDTSKYFVVMVDTLGNGISSSPSTSTQQPGDRFPTFTIADIVESQYVFLTRALGIARLHAVVGTSMGGMQAFQWAFSHPDFMAKVVSIVGSPQTQEDDRQRWAGGIAWLGQSASMRTKTAIAQFRPRTALNEWLVHPYDHIRQAQAISSFDVARPFGGSLERAATAVAVDLMVVGTWQDREVNPQPGFELARLSNAEVLELDGRCGHQAPSCERKALWAGVAQFLDRPSSSSRTRAEN